MKLGLDYYFSDEYILNFRLKFGTVLPNKLNGFLIDASVVHGSSGSLVFLRPQAAMITGGSVYIVKPQKLYSSIRY